MADLGADMAAFGYSVVSVLRGSSDRVFRGDFRRLKYGAAAELPGAQPASECIPPIVLRAADGWRELGILTLSTRTGRKTVGSKGRRSFLRCSRPELLLTKINVQQKGIEKMKIYNGKPWQADKGQKSMEDVVQAQLFIRDIGGSGKVSAMIGNAADFLVKCFPHKGEPRKQWTERRLWEWWNSRSEVVRHWQMMELYRAAEIKKQERALLEEARKEHAEFIAKTANLAALLERSDSDFHRDQIEALRGVASRVRRARTKGE